MLLAGFIARRLNLRPGNGKRSSAGAIIAVAGISLSLAIMLFAIAIVTGFKNEIRDKVTGFNAQITIYPADAFEDKYMSEGIILTDSLSSVIATTLPGCRTSLMLRQPAIFKTDDNFQGLILKGATGNDSRQFIENHLSEGVIAPADTDVDSLLNSVVISSTTANALNLKCGEKVNVHFMRDNSVATRRLKITGIYDTHFSEFDDTYAFVPIGFLQRLSKVESNVGSAIEIRGVGREDIATSAERLQTHLLMERNMNPQFPFYQVESVVQSCSVYFNWLDLLDTNVVVIIVLMTLVASFTLISSLFIIILERVKLIGLLKALGAANTQVRKIFIYLAERLVIRGLIIGNAIALGALLIQSHWHAIPLDAEAYYLNYVPVEIDWWQVVAVNLCAVIISLIVLILPSSMISRMSPANTLRFE